MVNWVTLRVRILSYKLWCVVSISDQFMVISPTDRKHRSRNQGVEVEVASSLFSKIYIQNLFFLFLQLWNLWFRDFSSQGLTISTRIHITVPLTWKLITSPVEMLMKGYTLPVIRGISSGYVMDSMVTQVNNSVFYTWKLLHITKF